MTRSDVIIALWGLLGGLFRALNTSLTTGVIPSTTHVVGNVMVAGFCGYLAAKIAGRIDPDWVMVAAGAGGYLGTQTVDILLVLVQQGKVPPK